MKTVFSKKLLEFINKSASPYHVVANIKAMLCKNGYKELCESENWEIEKGGKYFTVRSGSSIIAFSVPSCEPEAYIMAAAHSDSPSFKIKENPELASGIYTRLNTEKYGGMLMSTWFDRPLSVAGRVVVKDNGNLCTKLVNIDRDLLVIPSVAIHMNRNANDGMKYAANVDTVPLFGGADAKGIFTALVAKSAGVKENDILGKDLFLYSREKGTLIGADKEYICVKRICT